VARATLTILSGALVALLSCTSAWADDVVGPLRESIGAAPLIIEGEVARPYAAWDGTNPASIRTYTPFQVVRVLKGTLTAGQIIFRQPGGEVGGASAVPTGAEFSEGEQAIVLVGEQDPSDGSYDIRSGRKGAFTILHDEAGRAVLEVRLGADASAYSSREKAPGILLARVPLALFEQLASGATFESVAEFEHAHTREAPPTVSAPEYRAPASTPIAVSKPSRWRPNVLLAAAVLALLAAASLTHLLSRKGS
jgi:hypothetical protein